MQQEQKLFVNGRIFTANPKQPYADAMVVRNGNIVWIGSEADINHTTSSSSLMLWAKKP